jgi:hypothetical protein
MSPLADFELVKVSFGFESEAFLESLGFDDDVLCFESLDFDEDDDDALCCGLDVAPLTPAIGGPR